MLPRFDRAARASGERDHAGSACSPYRRPPPSVVVITGMKKPFRTVLSKEDYRAVRHLGDELRARKSRSVEV